MLGLLSSPGCLLEGSEEFPSGKRQLGSLLRPLGTCLKLWSTLGNKQWVLRISGQLSSRGRWSHAQKSSRKMDSLRVAGQGHKEA
jgi:hypothetical protein